MVRFILSFTCDVKCTHLGKFLNVIEKNHLYRAEILRGINSNAWAKDLKGTKTNCHGFGTHSWLVTFCCSSATYFSHIEDLYY
jgi:hypothetical protein